MQNKYFPVHITHNAMQTYGQSHNSNVTSSVKVSLFPLCESERQRGASWCAFDQ